MIRLITLYRLYIVCSDSKEDDYVMLFCILSRVDIHR